MVIYLVRHGETDWNIEGRLQGREDIPLNENGVRQAYACAKALGQIPIDCILTSPLRRAKKTAEIIAGQISVSDVIVEEDLTERDFGELSGHPPRRGTIFQDFGAVKGMEALDHVTKRQMRVLDSYRKNAGLQHVLVVSHGAAINALLSSLSNGAIGTGKTVLKNTCINKLSCSGPEIAIDYYNVTPDELTAAENRKKIADTPEEPV